MGKKNTNNKEKSKSLKKGDKVKWNSRNGESKGKLIKKVTNDKKIKKKNIKASKDNPKYLVESKKGKKALHKAKSLKKL